MLFHVVENYNWDKYFTFRIFSIVGWREQEKFFYPSQIWYLKPTEEWEFENDSCTLVDTIRNLNLEQYVRYKIDLHTQHKMHEKQKNQHRDITWFTQSG